MNENTTRKIRAFTLIELMMVFSVIGLLVAFALPNYIEQNQKIEIGLIQKDILLVESYVGERRILDPGLLEEFEDVPISTVNAFKEVGDLYNRHGKVSSIRGATFKYIPISDIKDDIPLESKGAYFVDNDGNVYMAPEKESIKDS